MTVDRNLVDAVGDMLDDLVKMLPYMDEESVSDAIGWLGRALDKAEAVRDAPDVRDMQPEEGSCKYPFSACEECKGKYMDVMDWVCDKDYCIVRCAACGHTAVVPTVPFKPKGMSTKDMVGILKEVVNRSEARLENGTYEERHTGSDGDMYYLRDE